MSPAVRVACYVRYLGRVIRLAGSPSRPTASVASGNEIPKPPPPSNTLFLRERLHILHHPGKKKGRRRKIWTRRLVRNSYREWRQSICSPLDPTQPGGGHWNHPSLTPPPSRPSLPPCLSYQHPCQAQTRVETRRPSQSRPPSPTPRLCLPTPRGPCASPQFPISHLPFFIEHFDRARFPHYLLDAARDTN